MGNVCCTPSVSGSGHLDYQSSPADADRTSAEGSPRSRRQAGTDALPISPRRSDGGDERRDYFSALPRDLQAHIGSLLPRDGRSALRQTAHNFQQALPRGGNDAMPPMTGMYALLDMHSETPNNEVSLAVESAVRAASNHPEWQNKILLLLAARHAVRQREHHPDRSRLLQKIESAIETGGVTAEHWRDANHVFDFILRARGAR